MSSKSVDNPFPKELRERLVIILHPKRTSLIFFYVFSFVLTIIGISFMSATAYGAIPLTLISWILSNGAIVAGPVLFVLTEMRRYYTFYIITTWNVRVRRGIVWRKTIRLFYDEISECRTTIYPDERRVGMGDVEICSNKAKNGPVLIFEEIENPDGVREIISRFIQTIPFPIPWAHLERG